MLIAPTPVNIVAAPLFLISFGALESLKVPFEEFAFAVKNLFSFFLFLLIDIKADEEPVFV